MLLMPSQRPGAKELLADKGYGADSFREALANRKIAACIPSKSERKAPIPTTPSSTNSATEEIETMFGRTSRTGGASTPDTTVAPTPTSLAICIAAAVIFWL